MISNRMRSAFVALWIVPGCSYYSGSVGEGGMLVTSDAPVVFIHTKDRVLKEELCSYVGRAACTPGKAALKHPAVSVRLDVQPSQAELWRSILLSTATLTSGVFVFRSAPAVLRLRSIAGDPVSGTMTLPTQGRVGYYAFLPLYAGLIATVGGGIALRAEEPAQWQKQCMTNDDAQACERYRGYVRSVLDFSGKTLISSLRSVLGGRREG